MKQRSVMVWFTGLSGSGKSTVAIALERELHKCGLLCRILDGDNIRSGINNNLGFSAEDRVENIRRIAEVSKLFIDTGVITIAAFISPNNDLREMAASIVGKENFLEIYVSTPIEECERRDVKGLYAKARRGEILGISGLVGAGRTEIMKVVFGAEKAQWGEIYVNGKKADIRSPKDAMHKYGICLIPEDRKREGCFLGETISWNLVYNVVEKISHGGVVDRKKEAEIANYYGEAMRIKAPNLDATKVGTLSGGNQQKVVVGKALATQSDIVIFDEPTRGIDVGAKYEIYELMNGLCEEGKCVVMVTSDMEELLGMSDRIVVFGEKCLAGELTKEEFSQERILDMASTSDRENENMGA